MITEKPNRARCQYAAVSDKSENGKRKQRLTRETNKGKLGTLLATNREYCWPQI